MTLNESDTRAKLIDPAIHTCGWTEDLIRREETAGAIVIEDGKPMKKSKGRVDYVLRVKVSADSQPVAVALIEAKAENLPPNPPPPRSVLRRGMGWTFLSIRNDLY
jgi:type I restriction enzyme R subunit